MHYTHIWSYDHAVCPYMVVWRTYHVIDGTDYTMQTVIYIGPLYSDAVNPNPNPNPKVMPNLKPSMGDSTLHSGSVVAVVCERQGAQLQMHCAKRCDVSTVSNSMVCHSDPVRHFSSGTLVLLRVKVLGNSCARAQAMAGAGGVVPVIVYRCSCTEHDYHISLA